MKKKGTVLVLFLLLGLLNSQAQDFVYTPVNPAFGGSFYNYSWMLSSAEAQNSYEAETDDEDYYSYDDSNTLDDFVESLNSQILSQLSLQIVSQQFGEDALETGTYILGDYQIDIGDGGSGLKITILDNTSGATTTVEVPYF